MSRYADWYGETVQVVPDGPYPLGKYSTLRDEYLHRMAQDGWANESFGDVEAPTGYVYRISNAATEIPEIFGAFGPVVEGVVGDFLVQETDLGFVYAYPFDSEAQLREHYDALEREYDRWASQDEDAPDPDHKDIEGWAS
jgi:hypothetical protein